MKKITFLVMLCMPFFAAMASFDETPLIDHFNKVDEKTTALRFQDRYRDKGHGAYYHDNFFAFLDGRTASIQKNVHASPALRLSVLSAMVNMQARKSQDQSYQADYYNLLGHQSHGQFSFVDSKFTGHFAALRIMALGVHCLCEQPLLALDYDAFVQAVGSHGDFNKTFGVLDSSLLQTYLNVRAFKTLFPTGTFDVVAKRTLFYPSMVKDEKSAHIRAALLGVVKTHMNITQENGFKIREYLGCLSPSKEPKEITDCQGTTDVLDGMGIVLTYQLSGKKVQTTVAKNLFEPYLEKDPLNPFYKALGFTHCGEHWVEAFVELNKAALAAAMYYHGKGLEQEKTKVFHSIWKHDLLQMNVPSKKELNYTLCDFLGIFSTNNLPDIHDLYPFCKDHGDKDCLYKRITAIYQMDKKARLKAFRALILHKDPHNWPEYDDIFLAEEDSEDEWF